MGLGDVYAAYDRFVGECALAALVVVIAVSLILYFRRKK